MTPAARIAAAIELLAAVDDAPERPADAVANEWFRARRFIGAGDRRVVAERVWQIVRARRRLEWRLRGTPPTPRLLVRMTQRQLLQAVDQAFAESFEPNGLV